MAPAEPRIGENPSIAGRVAGEEDDARLALTGSRSLDSHLVDDRARDPVDEVGSRRGRLDAASRSDSSTQPVPVAAPSAPGMSSVAPFGAMVSSVAPSVETVVALIVWLIVSPVVRAAAMIVVPSISPTTIRALRPRRRPTLRTASFTRIGFRRARAASAHSEMPSPTRRTTRRVSTGMPKTSFIGYATKTPSMSANATS